MKNDLSASFQCKQSSQTRFAEAAALVEGWQSRPDLSEESGGGGGAGSLSVRLEGPAELALVELHLPPGEVSSA